MEDVRSRAQSMNITKDLLSNAPKEIAEAFETNADPVRWNYRCNILQQQIYVHESHERFEDQSR